MITELLLSFILAAVEFIDSLIPPIPWPSWLSAPAEFFANGGVGGVNLAGVFVFVHPVVYDLMLLVLTLLAAERFVRRLRAMLSTATGGGGVSS